jgi:hypothetical protein
MHTYPVGLQNHMATFMAISDEHLSEPWSAWTAIGITELAISDAHVEIRVPLDYLNKKTHPTRPGIAIRILEAVPGPLGHTIY